MANSIFDSKMVYNSIHGRQTMVKTRLCSTGRRLTLKLQAFKNTHPNTQVILCDICNCDCGKDHYWRIWALHGDGENAMLAAFYSVLTSISAPDFQFYDPEICPAFYSVDCFNE